jgi:hypothetical protein
VTERQKPNSSYSRTEFVPKHLCAPLGDVAGIAAKRRNKSNPWFKRGTLFRSAVDVLRRAQAPMTAREIADALIADTAPQATRKQAIDLQAAILCCATEAQWWYGGWRGRACALAIGKQGGGRLRR